MKRNWICKACDLMVPVTVLSIGVMTPNAGAVVTNIDLSTYYNGPWSTNPYNGPEIAAASITGNTGTGITFPDYAGEYVYTGPNSDANSRTLAFSPVPVTATSDVNALINSAFGVNGTNNGTITFLNNAGQQAVFELIGGQTIRDFNNGGFDNALQGYNTNPAFGPVTSQQWWNNSALGGNQRLDVDTFVLPASWAGSSLTGMTIVDPYATAGTADEALSAMQVVTVPEPMLLSLLALTGIGLLCRRQAAKI